ncbi:MAG: FHIPEP family type III secretion protein [Candidatus Eremiobacteraeota bacterium]|nr:FHIPEP family type III secretion protein [Candidatus Eremiobacteraeota bacterium]MCW5866315.1 FHIPEP family type III secretion protein [Candidatus Eremiobacteraeota bacterium]
MLFTHLGRKRALIHLSLTLSLLLLALSAWALARAFRLHQSTDIQSLEGSSADFLHQLCPGSHLEVVQEFPLHLVVTADTDPATLEQLKPALTYFYNLEESRGEQLLVVPGQAPFYWVDHGLLAVAITLAGLLLTLPGLIYLLPRRRIQVERPVLSKVILTLTLAATVSFGLVRHGRPQPSLARWLEDDLGGLTNNRSVVVAVLERDGRIRALAAADPGLHPLIQVRAKTLGLDSILCLAPSSRQVRLWPWAGLALLVLPAGACWSRRARRAAPLTPVKIRPAPPIRDSLRVEELQIDIGRGLLGLIDPDQGAELLERLSSMRRHIALELGVLVPHLHFRDQFGIKPNRYQIYVRGTEVASGEVWVNQFLAIGPEYKLKNMRGTRVVDPTCGMPGVWISPEQRGDAERLGCMLFDSVSVMATHINETIRRFSADLLTFQMANERLENSNLSVVLAQLDGRGINRIRLWKTLRALLQERVSIRDLQCICEGLLAVSHLGLDDEGLLDYARRALGKYKNNEDLQHDVLAGQSLEEETRRLEQSAARIEARRQRIRRRRALLLERGE